MSFSALLIIRSWAVSFPLTFLLFLAFLTFMMFILLLFLLLLSLLIVLTIFMFMLPVFLSLLFFLLFLPFLCLASLLFLLVLLVFELVDCLKPMRILAFYWGFRSDLDLSLVKPEADGIWCSRLLISLFFHFDLFH